MMNKDEAVNKIATEGRLSMSRAEDLYDSLFEKPVVPQCVAKWYEGNKRNLDLNLCSLVFDLAMNSMEYYREEFKAWVNDNKKTFITTLVNMHQFGYEVEEETRYTVKMKGIFGYSKYLNRDTKTQTWLFASKTELERFRAHHTRKELEDADFGWVFSCPGVEVKEVTDE